MGDSEKTEAELHKEFSCNFNDNKTLEFTREEKNQTIESDLLVNMEETVEKLFFSDKEDTFPSLLADFPCFSSPSPAPASEGTEVEIIRDEIELWENCRPEEKNEFKWDPSFFLSEETAITEEKVGFLDDGGDWLSEDLATVFLDWLKKNKDLITAEDLRSIKLKRSTIECATRRLGGGKQGKVQLLKLILSWVQNHHLQKGKKRLFYPPNPPTFKSNIPYTQKDICYDAIPSNWISYNTGESSFSPVMPVGRGKQVAPCHYYKDEVFTFEPWQQGLSTPAVHYSVFGQNMPLYYQGKMSSATKEARKKRMARHRKNSSFYHNRFQQGEEQEELKPQQQKQHESLEKRVFAEERDRRRDEAQEGMKADKNYRFLLQKVLKQSDVGSLGRIVLPKKEAEINLPELDARDGISIQMEDIGTSTVWNMRYRFWPNNKSRMYLLENTGGFVRSNGLKEGDFIVIYSDTKCGKYMIRGVKVRHPVDVMKKGGKTLMKQEKSSSNMHTCN